MKADSPAAEEELAERMRGLLGNMGESGRGEGGFELEGERERWRRCE